MRRVQLAARRKVEELGAIDIDWSWGERRWREALDAYYDVHEEILLDADARSTAFFSVDETREKTDHLWHVHQIFSDPDADHDFGIAADVDLDATQDTGEVVFKNYRAGFVEDLLGRDAE